MSTTEEKLDEPSPALPPELPQERSTLATVAWCFVIAAAGWFLLKEFAPILRPLLLAVLLCYFILPAHLLLSRYMPRAVALAVLGIVSVGSMYLLALLIYTSASELSNDLPHWVDRGQILLRKLKGTLTERLPWIKSERGDEVLSIAQGESQAQTALNAVIRAAADTLTESVVVGFYLLFLLLEVHRFPNRVRNSFAGAQAAQVLAVAANINQAMSSFLRVKVKASLVLAVPVTLILWAFGVKFPLLWGVLTFLANFIPYLGSVVMCSLPILLSFLQMDFDWRPFAVAALLISCHAASAYLIEPTMTGRAVGLSPLVILFSLAFWGLGWGLIGMILAVPLTVMLKIVLENLEGTRPFARLMGDE